MTVSERGFTLLEIMVSMALMAIVLATFFKLQSSTITLSMALDFKETAPVLARQQLAALAMAKYNPDDLPQEFQDDYKGYSSTCEVTSGRDLVGWEEILSLERVNQLKKITITIYSPDREREFTLETWRYAHEE